MRNVLLVLMVLVLATLACNLTEDDEEPTPAPQRQPVLVVTPTSQAVFATETTVLFPTPTPSPFAGTTPCIPNNTWPIYRVQPGDTLSGIAQRSGTTVDVLAGANCLSNVDIISVGQALRVPVNPGPPPATDIPSPSCQYQWFFTFNQGAGDLTDACPGPVQPTQGFGQDFEGGRVLRSTRFGLGDVGPTIWIVYNDGTWETYPDTWDTTQAASDPAISPPAGRYQPTEAIGKVWRENEGVRAKLGWALEPAPVPFPFRFQQPQITWPDWPDGNVYWYIDHGKWGLVLRMFSIDLAPNRWEVVGSY
jgi:LysM repeat protein